MSAVIVEAGSGMWTRLVAVVTAAVRVVAGRAHPVGGAWRGREGRVRAAVVAVLCATLAVRVVRRRWKRAELSRQREQKQRQCRQALKDLAAALQNSTVSVEEQEEILALPLVKLRDRLRAGTLKAVDVLQTYQIKALAVNRAVNAITEPVKEAMTLAERSDNMIPREDQLLYGVPISIKDNFGMAGYDSAVGLSRWINRQFSDDAVIVKVLKHHGAVPFVRTNVPQTLLSWDTCNPIFGQTLNPHGENRSAGGSSGGEGALIASGGSCLGIGGDIGGSIRIPSHLCGIYGFKPTAGRVSVLGAHPIYKGQTLIPSAYGPMARDVDGIVLGFRALVSSHQHVLDSTVVPLPFRDELYERRGRLRIGYYIHDDYIHAVPSMQRAVMLAIAALKRLGHEVIEWNFPKLGQRGSLLWSRTVFADGGAEILENLEHDVTDHSSEVATKLLRLNNHVKHLLAILIKPLFPNIAENLRNMCGCSSVYEWGVHVKNVKAFRREVEHHWKEHKLDAVICPGLAVPAPPVGLHRFASGAVSYTCTYNTLDFPAGSMPVTKVTRGDIEEMEHYPTPDPWHRTIKKMVDAGSEGLPCNVQVITLPWEEEKCLSVMKQLEEALQSETPTM